MSDTQGKLQSKYSRDDLVARKNALEYLLKSYEGKKLLWWMLEQCGIARTPFASNALQMSFNCGAQNIGLMLQAEINQFFPEAYVQMIQELSNERADRDRRLADAARDDARADGRDDGDDD